jgi:hypothetical protein
MLNGEKRLGKFTLDLEVFKRWEELPPLFGNFVIVEARYRYDLRSIEYIAYSGLFDVIDPGVSAPEYLLEIALMPDGPAVIKAHHKDHPIPHSAFRTPR